MPVAATLPAHHEPLVEARADELGAHELRLVHGEDVRLDLSLRELATRTKAIAQAAKPISGGILHDHSAYGRTVPGSALCKLRRSTTHIVIGALQLALTTPV